MTFTSPQNIPLPHLINRLSTFYALYRVVLSGFLLIVFLLTSTNPAFGREAPLLFLKIITVYLGFSVFAFILILYVKKWIDLQSTAMLLVDITALTGMLYANGGPNLQMSMFYLVVVMAASILLPSTKALMITLLAIITIVYQQFFYALSSQADLAGISSALVLGFTFIAAYFLGQYVTNRLTLYEELAVQRGQKIKQLQEVNQRIIEEMKNGVMALDLSHDVMMLNEATKKLLAMPLLQNGVNLKQLMPDFFKVVQALSAGETQLFAVMNKDQMPITSLSLSCIEVQLTNAQTVKLVMLENIDNAKQQAQQLKLASLGRLTAGIAHEIRNPLSAISQASELLTENFLQITTDCPLDQQQLIQQENQLLVGMVSKQSARINRIIEDILQFSRQSRALPASIFLKAWFDQHLPEMVPRAIPYIDYKIDEQIQIVFDTEQFTHVMINLLENALHHASKDNQTPQIMIRASIEAMHTLYLDVIDSGAGVSDSIKDSLFEPFNTTEQGGTGLGLYLSRAFCEANGVHLILVNTSVGACFRMIFKSNYSISTFKEE